MRLFEVKLKLESPYTTDWQADTIWGHLCWALRYAYGEAALKEFIDSYKRGEPPLVVSNGFPGDFLPRLVLPDKSLPDEASFEKVKEQKIIRWLNLNEFNRVLSGEDFDFSKKKSLGTSIIMHNQINRLTGTTGSEEIETSGKLFSIKQYQGDKVTIYLKIKDDFINTIKELLKVVSKSGFGKRKSVGYGQFNIESFEFFAGFASPPNANGFMSLSNFVPAANDPTVGYWEVLVKYGKFGEEYAVTGNPHKKPLLMLRAGSCFYNVPCREYYGRLVTGLSDVFPETAQYALALPVPLLLPERP